MVFPGRGWNGRWFWNALTCLAIGCGTMVQAGDWPQILGPQRNGVAEDEQLLATWPKGTLPTVWEAEIGEGYAGPAIVEDHVFVLHRVENRDVLQCRSLDKGEVIWEASEPAEYRGGINSDRGPRCVPVVVEDRVFTWSAAGVLRCFERATGRRVWQRDLFADFSGYENYFGAGSTPLVTEGLVLVNVGGRKGDSGIVAVDAQTGADRWQATDERTSYAAPVLTEFEGAPLAVFITRLKLIGLRPTSGEIKMQMSFGKPGATVNAAMPLVTPEGLFLSSSYGVGAAMVEPAEPTPKVIWANDRALSSQYFTSVWYDGYLYGIDGREDLGGTSLRCVDGSSGKVIWEQAGVPGAHVIRVDNRLLVVDVEGGLRVIQATPEGYLLDYQTRLFATGGRALPALSHGYLVVRNNAEGGVGSLRCFAVGDHGDGQP